jgi:hypothetical protein
MSKAYHFATGAREGWGRWLSGVLKGPTDGTAADSIFLERVLPQDEFLERLRSEKRRVDRSRAPLSLSLFVLGEELLRDAKKLRGFLVNVKQGTRETDIKGWVSHQILGLLLPDTDGPGAKRCLELLTNSRQEQICTVVTGTYPDQFLEWVLQQTQDQSKMFSLDRGDAPGRPASSRSL